MLFVITYCIYKSTSYIYLFNNCKEKCAFSTRPQVLRDQISPEILVGMVIFFSSFQKFTSQASRDPNFTSKTRAKQSLLRLEYFIFYPFYFEHLRSGNVWVLKLIWPKKPALFVWQRNYHVNRFIYRKLWNYTAIFGSFSIPNEQRQ